MASRPLEYPALYETPAGRDCYVLPATIAVEATRGYSKAWRVHGKVTTILRRDGTYLKSLANFSKHNATADDFHALLDECYSLGCYRPTAYHDAVYSQVAMPRVKWSINALFASRFAGGWQEALDVGVFPGFHAVYDIQSAYLSALHHGLPDPDTYRLTRTIGPDALYVIEHEPRDNLPYPFSGARIVNATQDEIDIYGLHVVRVIAGVRWSNQWDTDKLTRAIMGLTFWKQAGRSYWGRWGMSERVEMLGGNTGTVTELKSVFTNLIWSHLILSRIRMRLYHEVITGNVRHVFTDSILTTATRRIHPFTVGAWKLERTYADGVRIKGPGAYGPIIGPLDKHAGQSLARAG